MASASPQKQSRKHANTPAQISSISTPFRAYPAQRENAGHEAGTAWARDRHAVLFQQKIQTPASI